MMQHLVDILRSERQLSARQYRSLLTTSDRDAVNYLYQAARETACQHFGHGVYVRALIELTNQCRNDCLYCGIRHSNRHVARYALTQRQVLDCCQQGYELGFRTIVLQGGEWSDDSSQWIADMVANIRAQYPDCAITLSLGEHSRDTYALWRKAGADRYLLRHEAHNAKLYSLLHPADMSLSNRLQCLEWLKQLGYQVGCGIMVGAPFQTIGHLVEDILFITRFKPQMVGIGPFMPHHDTPMRRFQHGSAELTTRLYALLRLAMPSALMPTTTALATLDPYQGLERGIMAGANVVMPCLTPAGQRGDYALYDGKTLADDDVATRAITQLQQRLATIGYHIDWDRGDAK